MTSSTMSCRFGWISHRSKNDRSILQLAEVLIANSTTKNSLALALIHSRIVNDGRNKEYK